MADHGIGKGDVATGAIAYVIIVFNCIAIYNVIELTFIIWTTFKRHSGLYFWSFIVATYGIAIYSTGFILMNETPYTANWFYATCVAIGWPMMVTGQSMVLYSRLHLVLLDRRILRYVLWMIIIDAVIGHVPTIVFIYGANGNSPHRWISVYSVYEKVQVTIFFLQETIISALYISETIKTMKLQQGLHTNTRTATRLLRHLIIINILIIAFDVTILGLEYASIYDVQTSYKALVYAVKLKLEFSVLNKLVEATTAQKELSGGSHITSSAANAIGFPVDGNDGGNEEMMVSSSRRRPDVSYRASIRGGLNATGLSTGTSLENIRDGVAITREVRVQREERGSDDEGSDVEFGRTRDSTSGRRAVTMTDAEIDQALKSCSQVHLSLETWPDDAR